MFQQNVAAIEAQIAAFIAKVKAQAPILLADAETAVDLACGIVPTANAQITSFANSLANPGPKVKAALALALKDAGAAQAACDSYVQQKNDGTITLTRAINFGVAIWNAYQAGKTDYQKLSAAAAS
jgi:hypothetical protein